MRRTPVPKCGSGANARGAFAREGFEENSEHQLTGASLVKPYTASGEVYGQSRGLTEQFFAAIERSDQVSILASVRAHVWISTSQERFPVLGTGRWMTLRVLVGGHDLTQFTSQDVHTSAGCRCKRFHGFGECSSDFILAWFSITQWLHSSRKTKLL